MSKEVFSVRCGPKILKELEREAKAYHGGRVGTYVLHLLESDERRKIYRTMAKQKTKGPRP